MRSIALLLAAAVTAVVLAAGCQQGRPEQQRVRRDIVTKDEAIQIARRHVAQAYPGVVIEQQPRTVEFVMDQQVLGGQIWNINFACPAPPAADGKPAGNPPMTSVTVWVLPDGKVRGVVTHAK
jgi:hypothetical protein